MDILNVIALIICTMTGVVAGWVWGYGAGYREAARKEQEFTIAKVNRQYDSASTTKPNVYIQGSRDLSASRPDEARCIHCGAIMPNHYHGCPFAAQWQLVTITKPGE